MSIDTMCKIEKSLSRPRNIKKANFLGIVSLFLFVIDIILLVVFKSKFKA